LDSQEIILSALAGKEIEEADDLDKRIALLKKKGSIDDKLQKQRGVESIYKIVSEMAFPLFKRSRDKMWKIK